MIRISRKADYAIFLLTCLARQQKKARLAAGEQPRAQAPLMSAAELAELSGISRPMVANLLKQYSHSGLLESVRGTHGGYRLARPAEGVNLREILHVIDGPVVLVDCSEHVSSHSELPAEDICGLTTSCPAKGPLAVLHNRIIGLLEQMPLSELAYSATNPYTQPCGLEFTKVR